MRASSVLDETDLNANSTATVTSILDVTENQRVSWTVLGISGVHMSHVIDLRCSNVSGTGDFVALPDGASQQTGLGSLDNIPTGVRFLRAQVSTAQGSSSVVRIVIVAK